MKLSKMLGGDRNVSLFLAILADPGYFRNLVSDRKQPYGSRKYHESFQPDYD